MAQIDAVCCCSCKATEVTVDKNAVATSYAVAVHTSRHQTSSVSWPDGFCWQLHIATARLQELNSHIRQCGNSPDGNTQLNCSYCC